MNPNHMQIFSMRHLPTHLETSRHGAQLSDTVAARKGGPLDTLPEVPEGWTQVSTSASCAGSNTTGARSLQWSSLCSQEAMAPEEGRRSVGSFLVRQVPTLLQCWADRDLHPNVLGLAGKRPQHGGV